MHPAGAPGFRVQCAFKDSSEDGRRNIAPIKILAGAAEYEVNHFIPKSGYLNVLVCKQAAVDIGERCQVVIQVLVPLGYILIQYPEQIDKRPPILRAVVPQVVMEHTLVAKNPSVLSIQAEHQADAQLIQTFQRFWVAGVFVLLQECII